MSIAKAIIIDEIIEDSHIENVEDVIFWALEFYADQNKGTNGSIIAYAIKERIKEAEKRGAVELQNTELIESLNL